MFYSKYMDITEKVGDSLLNNSNKNTMNKVDKVDVALMSLALADFTAAGTALIAHDYFVASGLFVGGIILTYLYHKYGSQ